MYPLIAVIGGASCCISLPGIFLDFTPLASSILLVPMWVDVLNVLYYLLPFQHSTHVTHITTSKMCRMVSINITNTHFISPETVRNSNCLRPTANSTITETGSR